MRIEEPKNRRSRETRTAILDAAWRLLEQDDGAGVTMSAVAEAADVSRRGLYLHFSSRGQLFAELFDHIDHRLDLESSIRPVLHAPDAVTALEAMAHHIASYHVRLVPVIRAVDRLRHHDADARGLWERSMSVWYAGCHAAASALHEQGQLAEPWTPETAADLMWALMSVEFVDDLINERGWTQDEFAQRLWLLVRRTLVVDH